MEKLIASFLGIFFLGFARYFLGYYRKSFRLLSEIIQVTIEIIGGNNLMEIYKNGGIV